VVAAVTILHQVGGVGHRWLSHPTSGDELQQFYLREVEPEMVTEDLLMRGAS